MEKIKQTILNKLESDKGKDILVVIIVILVGLGSFELGRLSKEDKGSGIKIGYSDQAKMEETGIILPQTFQAIPNPTGKTFFASSKGSKYYTISCSAGKTIKQENRIYFTTGEEAQRAGYTLSSSCN